MCLYMCRRIKFGSTIPVHLPPFQCLYLNGPIPYIADRSGCFPDPAHQHPMSPTNHGHTAYVACHHTLKCCICSRFLPPFCVDFSVSKGSTSRDLQSWAGSGIIAPTHVLSCSPARPKRNSYNSNSMFRVTFFSGHPNFTIYSIYSEVGAFPSGNSSQH